MAPKDVSVYTADAFVDYLVCGKCAQEFLLSNITDFINHKTSTCHQESTEQNGMGLTPSSQEPGLSCFICMQDFHTARGVLQHIQFEHNLKIFMQKAPLSVDTPFLVDDKHTTTSTLSAVDGACPQVTTITTTTSDQATTVMHISDQVIVTPSRKSNLPVTCARLASLDGTTICCNGSECRVTINSVKSMPLPPKCCSSVVPKKRDRHMKEHNLKDSDFAHQEKSVLETLATLRGRVLKSQRVCQTECKTPRLVCVGSECDAGVCNTDSGDISDENCSCLRPCDDDDDDSGMACSDDSADKGKTEKIKIISISDEAVTDRQTVIIKPGMTVTLKPKPKSSTESDKEDAESSVPSSYFDTNFDQEHNTSSAVDANMESAHILAEMMYHPPHSHVMPSQDSTVHLPPSMTLAPISETMTSTAFENSSPSFPATGFTAVPLTSHIPSAPFTFSSNPPVSGTLSDRPPQLQLEISHIPDLDVLTPSIHLFESQEQDSMEHSHVPTSEVMSCYNSSDSSFRVADGGGQKTQEKVKIMAQGTKKRRYPTSRPFKCSDCDQAFNQRIHLKKHMSKHTGVKPFKCGECQYSTVERSHLRAHVRIHTGEKPFSCPYCNYATAQNSTLKIHLKRHHSSKQQEI